MPSFVLVAKVLVYIISLLLLCGISLLDVFFFLFSMAACLAAPAPWWCIVGQADVGLMVSCLVAGGC